MAQLPPVGICEGKLVGASVGKIVGTRDEIIEGIYVTSIGGITVGSYVETIVGYGVGRPKNEHRKLLLYLKLIQRSFFIYEKTLEIITLKI